MNNEEPQLQPRRHHVNELDEGKKKSMKSRIIVGVILAVVAIPAVFLGGWFYFALISFFFFFATYEFIHAPRKKYPWYIWVVTYIVTTSYLYWAFAKSNISAYKADPQNFVFSLEDHFDEPSVSWYTLIGSLGIYFIVSILNKDFDFFDVCYLFAMSFLVGLGFQCLLFMRYHPIQQGLIHYGDFANGNGYRFLASSTLLFFVVICAFGNDIMAYFVGVFFGKHKMSPRVSPNKSWEGFFGGWILGGLLALGFAMIIEATGKPVIPSLPIFGPDSKWYAVVFLSFTLPLIGVIGDLTFSLVKRHFGIKDYSRLLAAHGGVLDRVDSLLFCSVFASSFIVVFEKGGSFFA